MARGAVPGSPYHTGRVVAAWALFRRRFLRGRLLLAGVDIDSLDFAELSDVTIAVMFDPALHGSFTSIDDLYEKLDEVALTAFPDRELWGTTESAVRHTEAAHAAFGEARPKE